MTYYRSDLQELEMFLRDLSWVFARMRKRWPKARAGFCFGLYDGKNHHLLLKGMVGKVRDFKLKKYEMLVEEKAHRLLTRLSDGSSYESRVPEGEQYGGAVRGTDYVLSISGLAKEHQDEALGMVALVLRKQANPLFMGDVAERTGNKFFGQLLKDCPRSDHSGD